MGASLYADRPAEHRRSGWELAAFVFFANAPDLDFIPGILVGEPHMFHRVATHSLAFSVMAALAMAFAFSWRGRAQAMSWARIAFFGTLSHLALDYFCAPSPSFGPALLWPFSQAHYASVPPVFPLLSSSRLLSWGNVVAVIAEAAIVGLILTVGVVRRALLERRRRPAPTPVSLREPAFSLSEASE